MTMQINPKLYFIIKNKVQQLKLYKGNEIGFAEIEVYEYDPIKVKFECEDKNSYVEIERFDIDKIIKIKAGETVELTKASDSDNILIPADYPIRVVTSYGEYNTLFTVKPKNLSWESVLKIRNHLEKIVTGLSYNLYKRKLGINVEGLDYNSSTIETLSLISQYYPQIKNAMNLIINEPLNDIENKYKKSITPRKLDIKSQRWLCNKGSSLNSNIYMPNIIYSRHSHLTYDNKENRWIKQILVYLKNTLKQLQINFDKVEKIYKRKKSNKEKELEIINDKLKKIQNVYGTDIAKRELYQSREYIIKDIEKFKTKIKHIENNIKEIDKINATISYYLNETWLKNIKCDFTLNKPTLKLLKDYKYSILYKFYRKIYKSQKKHIRQNKYVFAFKKTSKLYEYYVFILVIQILEELGYKWTKGWLADLENPLTMLGDLTSDTLIRLEKDNHYIILAYDTTIKKYISTKEYSHFIAHNNNAPDVRLAVYDKNDEFIACIIIDAKYRRYKYIYNEKADTNVMKQLTDYLSISHFDFIKHKKGQSAFDREAVKKVIAVYPKQDEGKPIEYKHYDNSIVLIQVSPSDESDEKIPFGYNNLKMVIENVIKENLNKLNL